MASDPLSSELTTFHLFTYCRSSCSARLRIALNLKGIQTQSTFINLIAGNQNDSSHAQLNPSKAVPTLLITSGDQTTKITQSIAALEYLEEAFPSKYPLLPPLSSPTLRATVRTLVNIIACDIQPPTNLRVLVRARALAGSGGKDPAPQWARELMTEGLLAYEDVCKGVAGRYSVGDEVTMADVCLVPTVWGAERWGVDFSAMPSVWRIYEEMGKLEVVKKSHWRFQADTPENLRK